MKRSTKKKPARAAAAPRWTNAQMAEALGYGERHLQRMKAELPQPRAGEDLASWAERARATIVERAAAKPRVGPVSAAGDARDPTALAHWLMRKERARALLSEIEAKHRAGLVHDRESCDSEKAEACAVLRQALQTIVMQAGRTCANKPESFIIEQLQRLHRAAFANLQRSFETHGTGTERADARGAAVAGPDHAE